MGKKRNLPLIDGHKKGAKVIEKILEKALEVDIKYLTFYSFLQKIGTEAQQR